MLMARAGYNPESALELWGLLNMIEQDSHGPGGNDINVEKMLPFLRTHPQGEDRLANIEKHLPKARELYNETLKPTKAQQVSDALKKATKGKEAGKMTVQPSAPPQTLQSLKTVPVSTEVTANDTA